MDMHWLKQIVNKIKQTDPFFWYWELPTYVVVFILFVVVLLCFK